MRIRILGKVWSLRFAPNLGNRGDPTTRNKEIRVSTTLRGEEGLEVLIDAKRDHSHTVLLPWWW